MFLAAVAAVWPLLTAGEAKHAAVHVAHGGDEGSQCAMGTMKLEPKKFCSMIVHSAY
jgi:hypothetical protein